jgi:hypothetical protein
MLSPNISQHPPELAGVYPYIPGLFAAWSACTSSHVNEKEFSMDKAGKSVFIFAIYLFLLGIILITVPNFLLSIFAIPTTSEVWIRVVGMLVLVLSFYYIQASRRGLRDFFLWTVYARVFVFIALAAFVALRLAPLPLAMFGTIDLLGAIWTEVALRQQPLQQRGAV